MTDVLNRDVTHAEKRAALEPLVAACADFLKWAHERGGGKVGEATSGRRLLIHGLDTSVFDDAAKIVGVAEVYGIKVPKQVRAIYDDWLKEWMNE